MKAIVLSAYGDIEQLELRDVPEPTPGANEIKVRMAGASVNPVDWKLRSGELRAFMPLTFPAILGRDVSGTVVAVGPGVKAFKLGQRVMGLVQAGYAEFVVAPADAFAEVPADMDLVDAAALPLVLLTGAQLVEEAMNPAEGDVVLVTGAEGSVGRTAVFAAKARGAKVWAGVRTTQKEAAMKLGVAGVVAIDDDSDIAKLPRLDAIADTVGGEVVQKLFGKLKSGGTIASVVGEPAGAKERGFAVRGMMAHVDAKRLATLAEAVATGTLVIPIAKRFPLSKAREAQRLAEHHAGGKVIMTASAEPARAAPALHLAGNP
jgi:NADPH:quinone reductase-like Zn-dependent oxidoreductase